MPKGAFTFIRLLVLLLGFSTMCLGVLCISTSSSTCRCGNNELVFYCLLALGFFLLVAGIFWSTFHEVLKYRGLSSIFIVNPSLRELRVSTIDRPDFYPPSYEYSTDPEKQMSPLPVASALKQREVFSIPPPLYSESSEEFISETNEQEQPPSYELLVQQLQQQQTADQKQNPEGESNIHPQKKTVQQDADRQGTSERATPVKTLEIGSGQSPAAVKQRKLEEEMCQ
ncbi:transmembrane protein 252 [Melopsittacus undulatus]|uniref:transmembrane protein 252 n=1 Tax=Melopsittacus undulatus TaxID=13146 RepID=UPI0003835283|nr:transmembrane protein 252 [Melopsittacus undulatus]